MAKLEQEERTRAMSSNSCTPALWLFMERYVHLPAFDLASDAFATLREMLVTHDKVRR